MRGKITDALKQGKVLVSDGAWGTFLVKKGMQSGECPELWNAEHFDAVADIARQYIDAGSQMVQTNTLGGTRCKLAVFGLAERAAELNEAAARASRSAAGDDIWVIASVGPTGKMLITEEITEEEMYEAFKEQAVALEKGGADAVCIETMSDAEEACIAVRAAKENTNMEVICTFTFEKTKQGLYRSMMGLGPTEAAVAAAEAGADIIGTNCGNGMERMADIVREMKAARPGAFILVHANAGLPQNVDNTTFFPETPEDMAGFIPAVVAAGANIVGGCCGTTPDHIRAFKNALEN